MGRLQQFCPEAVKNENVTEPMANDPAVLENPALAQELAAKRAKKNIVTHNILSEPLIPLPKLDPVL